jgi:hypothetical protein
LFCGWALSPSSWAAIGSQGTEFWLAFPQSDGISSSNQELFITSVTSTSGSVQIPGIGFSTSFSVSAGGTASIILPNAVDDTDSDGVSPLGIHVTSQNPVAVYGFNAETDSSDGYLGLPVNALGIQYIIMSYTNSEILAGVWVQLTVAGTQNGTSVTITPPVTTGTHPANMPYAVALDQGDVYQLQDATAGLDYTGTLISSNLPVAVWGGDSCANVPATVATCNYITEQLWPTQWWGVNFVSVPLATRVGGDTFRFLASEDGTSVSVNGTPLATLNRGQFVEQTLTAPSNITSNYPIYAAQFSNSRMVDNAVKGDPSMITLSPVSAWASDYLVPVPWSGFSENYENITAPASIAGAVTLDGTPIPAATFVPIGSSGLSGAAVSMTVAAHRLTAPAPFGVLAYGFEVRDAYGYPGGALFFNPTPTATPTSTPTSTPTATVSQTPTIMPTPTYTPLPCPPGYTGPQPPGPGDCFTYPAPASGGQVHFVYYLQEAGKAQILVRNERADLVAELSNEQGCGVQEAALDLSRFAAGVYFYQVTLTYGSGQVEKLRVGKFLVQR